mgnify:CR=1 FL=1
MTQLTLDSAHGELLKHQGQAAVEDTDQGFVAIMRECAREISDQAGFVTCDNLRLIADGMGLVPKHQNSWGSIFRGSHWKIIGRQKSALPSSHAREIKIWKWEP